MEELGGDIEGALGSISVPSYLIDSSGVIRWVNPAALKVVGDVRGSHYTSVVAPEDTRRARELFAQKIMGTTEVTDSEGVLLGKSGERISVEISSVPLKAHGRVIGVFGQLPHVADEAPDPPDPRLTPRQAEVLRLLSKGRATGQIADELNVSKDTVRNHVRDILRAMGATSRLEAVALSHYRTPGGGILRSSRDKRRPKHSESSK
jgi:PAS domain S-box-containing protein